MQASTISFIVDHWAAISATAAALGTAYNIKKFKGLEVKVNGLLSIALKSKEEAGIERGRELQKQEFNTARAPRSPRPGQTPRGPESKIT